VKRVKRSAAFYTGYRRAILSLFAIVVLLTGVGVPGRAVVAAAPATTEPAVTIAPFLQDIRLTTADTTKKVTITLANGGQDTKKFHLTVVDFGSLDDSGGIAFAGTTSTMLLTKYSLAHWLKLQQSDVTIAGKQTATVGATLINEPSLQPGGHYAAIIATLVNNDDSNDNSGGTSSGGRVTVKQQLTALMLVTKVGGERYDLKLDSLQHDGNWQHLPQAVTLHFQNPGNVHVVPRGVVRVIASGVRQRVIAQGVINEDSAFVLPGANRKMTVTLHGISRPEPWPAHYTLQVDYRYDGLKDFASQRLDISFLNVPMLVIGLAGLTVVIIATVLAVKQVLKIRRKAR
jgi:hypothetical protein